ncbi:uncharacterized protein LOC6536225 isoform X1 [Drosophila yakuba]|uniref:Uncharacterized protein, isoform B n=1 Tax=Drosophila yakuba TaxID=7245 RepID=A0A0R1E5S8_DROYA|nr:uncharacterized protein LOC6536225 isoform X1 [Drosophila yakuba]KRK03185.1 uncharacterized protein Dyak_GE24845, isoform B [Drosophila yakuba]
MTSPFDGVACFWLSLIWIQLGLINAGLEFLKDFVPLHLVRLREIEDEERAIEGECTLGAISIHTVVRPAKQPVEIEGLRRS